MAYGARHTGVAAPGAGATAVGSFADVGRPQSSKRLVARRKDDEEKRRTNGERLLALSNTEFTETGREQRSMRRGVTPLTLGQMVFRSSVPIWIPCLRHGGRSIGLHAARGAMQQPGLCTRSRPSSCGSRLHLSS